VKVSLSSPSDLSKLTRSATLRDAMRMMETIMHDTRSPPAGTGLPADDAVDHLARALQPIVGALQDRMVGVGEWIEAIKIAAYRAAHESTNAERGQAIFSRMSIRTGMTRTEQINLCKRMLLGSGGRRSWGSHRLIRVLDGWFDDPMFLDSIGRPRPLATEGAEPSLRTLSKRFAGDVHALSVIAELQRYGLIRERGAGLFSPIKSYRQPGIRGAREFEQRMQRHLSSLSQSLRRPVVARRNT
jgi:hypothetical protein